MTDPKIEAVLPVIAGLTKTQRKTLRDFVPLAFAARNRGTILRARDRRTRRALVRAGLVENVDPGLGSRPPLYRMTPELSAAVDAARVGSFSSSSSS